ncbi:MAG: ribosome biogenesis GTP-binding protein YihA/YsxC [Alphaproteobacteria bacterium]
MGAPARAGFEAARRLFAGECRFVAGAASVASFPKSQLTEIAFAGRSNVGKSSLLNALVGRKALARVSRAPGRTRQINFFRLAGKLMLVDLPGYGFARASRAEQARWSALVTDYLQSRRSLRLVLLLIDARRGLMPLDMEVMRLLDEMAVSYRLVLTKCDLLEEKELDDLLARMQDELRRHKAAQAEIAVTSADSGRGIAELRAALADIVKP